MSGQKEARVDAIAERERRRVEEYQRALEARRQQCDQLKREAGQTARQARSDLERTRRKLDRMGQEKRELERRLRGAAHQRDALEQRFNAMKQETLDTQREARAIGKSLHADLETSQQDLARANQTCKELEQELSRMRESIARYDGTDVVEAQQRADAAEKHQMRAAAAMDVVQAQLDAYLADPIVGLVLQQTIEAARSVGYEVERSFSSKEHVDVVMKSQNGELVRVAMNLAKAKATQEQTPAERLTIRLDRDTPMSSSCIADTMKIFDKLRELGVATTLVLPDETTPSEPAERHPLPERERH